MPVPPQMTEHDSNQSHDDVTPEDNASQILKPLILLGGTVNQFNDKLLQKGHHLKGFTKAKGEVVIWLQSIKLWNITNFCVKQLHWQTPRPYDHTTPWPTHMNYNYDPGYNYFIWHNQNAGLLRPQYQKFTDKSYDYYPKYPTVSNIGSHTPPNPDITSHILQVQGTMTNMLHFVKEQYSKDRYMNDVKTCTGGNSEELLSWLLSIEKVVKLIDNTHEDICFAKVEGKLLKLFYSIIYTLKNYLAFP